MRSGDLLPLALGGSAGAVLRYLLDEAITGYLDSEFPFGIFTINVLGSLFLGIVTGAFSRHGLSSFAFNLLGTGFCGAFTTFSTFNLNILYLLEDHQVKLAISYLGSSLAVGFGLAYLGYELGRLL